MLRLLTFLYSQRNAILFIVLVAIGFNITIRYNDQQAHVFGDSVLGVTSRVQSKTDEFYRYFRYKKENEVLMVKKQDLIQEIQYLKKRLRYYEGMMEIDSCDQVARDTLLSKEKFNYLPCRAIRNTVNRNYNYITIDKGENQGVRADMGIISPQGIVGRVIRTSPDYSLALSMLNLNFKLSATTRNVRYVGLFEWNGRDPGSGYLNNIPIDAPIAAGDTVISSGYSTLFPEGFVVGTIMETSPNKQAGYYEAKVRLATNFRRLGNLYVVIPEHKAALDSLKLNLPE